MLSDTRGVERTCTDEIPALFARLKTVSLVVKHSQSAEAFVKTYESKLYEEDAMNPDIKSIESAISTLKVHKSSSTVFYQNCQYFKSFREFGSWVILSHSSPWWWQQWQTEIDEKQEVFHDMEDELQKARLISDRMFKAHNERDFDLDWHKERADQLTERWQNIHSQIDSRLVQMTSVFLSVLSV